jgi:uncharacterized membrane protein
MPAADSRFAGPGSQLALALELGVSLVYPFAVHGLVRLDLAYVGALALFALSALLLGVALFQRGTAGRLGALRHAGLAFVFSALATAAWFDRAGALLLYPIVVNLGLFAVFFVSLFRERTLIESLARLREPDLEAEKVRHCRYATWAWAGYFSFNAGVALALSIFAPLWMWTLYTGLVSYVLASLLGVAELVVRVRRFGRNSAGPFSRWLLPALGRLGVLPSAYTDS